jgi:hypothetical protein
MRANITSKTRKTITGGTRTKTVNNDAGTVNIVRRDKAGNITKNKTRNKIMTDYKEDSNAGLGGGYGYKKGGSVKKKMAMEGTTKAKKFAALAPPYNKATAADRIAGAKKNAKKK